MRSATSKCNALPAWDMAGVTVAEKHHPVLSTVTISLCKAYLCMQLYHHVKPCSPYRHLQSCLHSITYAAVCYLYMFTLHVSTLSSFTYRIAISGKRCKCTSYHSLKRLHCSLGTGSIELMLCTAFRDTVVYEVTNEQLIT